jgi:hypothetical protein
MAHTALTSQLDTTGLPLEYHNFADVFSEQEAYNLPHRELDLKIETANGELPLVRHVYFLSQAELAALWDFIGKTLKLGFRDPSRSSHGAPILFAKKDGSQLDRQERPASTSTYCRSPQCTFKGMNLHQT